MGRIKTEIIGQIQKPVFKIQANANFIALSLINPINRL